MVCTHIVTVLYKIARIEVDHDKAPGFASSLEDIVRHVPVMVSYGAGSAVREDDWGRGHPERVVHGEPGQRRNVRNNLC